jgi:hypothetical protein
MVLLPIIGSNPRKWMRIVIRAVENRWFDEFGEFYTYVIKNAEIVEVVDEEKLVDDIRRSVITWLDEGHSIDELKEQIAISYGIPEKFIDLILDRVKYELGLVEMNDMLIEPDF